MLIRSGQSGPLAVHTTYGLIFFAELGTFFNHNRRKPAERFPAFFQIGRQES